MREIKFKGKALKDYPDYHIKKSDWVYGFLIRANKKCYIILTEDIDDTFEFGMINTVQVDCKTGGQYTGLKDKNKEEIYKGDIVICTDMHDSNIWTAWERNGQPYATAVPFIIEKDEDGVDWVYPLDLREHPAWWKVIGNIYDNPELLKGGQK